MPRATAGAAKWLGTGRSGCVTVSFAKELVGHEWVGLMYKAGLSVDLGLMYTAGQGVPQDFWMMYAEGFPSHITHTRGPSRPADC